MGMWNDVRLSVRSLRRRPGFTVVAAGTLALGVGATTAIFSVANGVLLQSLPYPDSDELVVIWAADRTNPQTTPGGQVSTPDFRDIQAEVEGLEVVAQYTSSSKSVSGLGGPAEMVPGASVTRDLFRVFGADPVLGRTFTDEENRFQGPDAVVLSESFWRSRFGADPDVLGRTMEIEGRPHPIVGVAPAGFDYPAGSQLWTPVQNDDEGCGRGCVIYSLVGRLADGSSLGQARAELDELSLRLAEEYPSSSTDKVFRTITLRDLTVGDVRVALWVLMGSVMMVLLIACANVANLILVRGGSRRTEFAVRTALGAPRGRLVRQLMTENAVLAVAGGVGGIGLAWWGVWTLVRLAPPQLPRIDEVGLNVTTVAFALLLVALTSLIFGLAPALRLAREGVAQSLRRDSRGGVGRQSGQRARALVLVAEVALSVLLLLAAGLMLRSLVRMQAVDLGLDTENAVAFRLSLPSARYAGGDERIAFMNQLEARLTSLPEVEAVSELVAVPFGDVNLTGSFRRPDQPPPAAGETPVAGYRALDPDAPETLGIEIVRGRGFEASDRYGAEPVILINQAAADLYWPNEDPIGRFMDLQIGVGYPEDEPRRIIGITANFRDEVTSEAGPEMYVPYAQVAAGFPHVVIRTAPGVRPAAMLAAAQREVTALDPMMPVAQPASLEAMVGDQMAASRFYLLLLGLFAVMAVALAAVGIYGVVAYTVSQRTREIGMRMALGAQIGSVVRLVVWQGMGPALVGVAVGIMGALAAARVIQGILFDVEATDPVTYAMAAAGLLSVVLVATALPALRASRIPPAVALRAGE